jgi:Fe2+ transport system protein FeoA
MRERTGGLQPGNPGRKQALFGMFFIATESQYQYCYLMSAPQVPLTLCSAAMQMRLRILALSACSEDCLRLREMGFCESTEVRKLADGSAILCSLYGVRMALGRNSGPRFWWSPWRHECWHAG